MSIFIVVLLVVNHNPNNLMLILLSVKQVLTFDQPLVALNETNNQFWPISWIFLSILLISIKFFLKATETAWRFKEVSICSEWIKLFPMEWKESYFLSDTVDFYGSESFLYIDMFSYNK